MASACDDTGGVVYVPALLGLGTPRWDFGARGTLLGLTRGTGRPELVRAVLEGIAQRGADLVEAAEADTGLAIECLRVDGGMSANPTFVQALADATQRTVEVSPVLEATTLGAGFLAGLATSVWGSLDDIAGSWRPRPGRRTGSATRPGAVGEGRRARRRLDARPVRAGLLELPRPAPDRKAVAPFAPSGGPPGQPARRGELLPCQLRTGPSRTGQPRITSPRARQRHGRFPAGWR